MLESEEAAVVAQDLSKSFFNKVKKVESCALDRINIRVLRGKMTALVGPDGAGKTTFLRLVAGLITQSSGELSVLGLNVKTQSAEVQNELSYMPQKFGLYEDLSVAENMELYADLHGIERAKRPERFAKLLDMAGLTPFTERLAGKLSGGMKQKLGLVCTLVRSPKLLLLDEPTVGVDPLSRRDLWEIIQRLVVEEQITVLVSTAYMEEAEKCDYVYILKQGQVLTKGTPQDICCLTAGRCYQMALPPSVPARMLGAALLGDKKHVVDAVPTGGAVRFVLRKGSNLADLAAYRYFGPLATEEVAPRLEDSFMELLTLTTSESAENIQSFDYTKKQAISTTKDIEVRDLVRTFGDFVAVSHTTFDVRQGEIFGLLGPNGAGKTTTFRMLCGLLSATAGTAMVAGMDMRKARTQARGNLGYVAQKFSLYSDLTVDENLRFFGGAYGLRGAQLLERMQEVKEQFKLTPWSTTLAGDLPGGYKQRLSMAVGLIHKPRILFLDEPTSGIDPLARRIFWLQITALAAQGTTIVITTHFMDEAEYCDRMLIQDSGRIIALGTPQEILAQDRAASTMNDAFIAIVEREREEAEQSGH